MKKITVYRKASFNAAHRLHNPNWSEQKNNHVFGLCNNPNYHGHNYDLIVSVTGTIDPITGYVMDLKVLKELIKKHIIDYMDHKNLNKEIEEFRNLNTTVENIAVVIWERLRPFIPIENRLKITLYETPRNYVSYDPT